MVPFLTWVREWGGVLNKVPLMGDGLNQVRTRRLS